MHTRRFPVNIVLIVIDTLRYDYIRANGNDRMDTPNLDRLAARSLGFDRAFSASYPTIPHRTDVMTGRYGGPFHTWKPLPFDVQTLPWTLAETGYCTQLLHDTPHLVNGGHNFDWPFHAWQFFRGAEVDRSWICWAEWLENWRRDPLFDCLGDEAAEIRQVYTYARTNHGRKDPEDWNCAQLFQNAARFLRDNADRDNFFLWVDCFDPHEPWDAPPEFVLKYDDTPGYDGTIDPRCLFSYRNDKRLSAEARARIAALYPAKVSWMDHCLGQFLDALDATGLSQNTAVILTADHGTNVAERGSFGKGYPVNEQVGHVPFFICAPGVQAGRSRAIVQPQDVFATVMGLAGKATPEGIDSHDLLAVAQGDGLRALALSGNGAHTWGNRHKQDAAAVLFTAFTEAWVLGVAAKPEDSRLSALGSLDYVEKDHPETVRDLHAQAVDEVERRGADPALMAWLRSGGAAAWPKDCRFWDGWPGPAGYYTYFSRLYEGA